MGDLRNITVAVTPEQANKLILAQRYGTLSVTLRGSEDDAAMFAEAEGDRHMVNPYDLLGISPLQPVPEKMVQTAQIWRGGSMTEISFRPEQIQEAHDATTADRQRGLTPAVPVSAPHGEPTPAFDENGQPITAIPGRPTPALPTGFERERGGEVIQVRVEGQQVGAGRE